MHPRAKATSPTGTPGPGQWLSMGFQSCRLPARKPPKTLQTLQTVQNPPNPPNPPPSPAGTSDPQQWLSWGFQSCRLPARKGCNPPKIQTPSLTGQGHFPNRHPRARAKATSPTGTPGPGHSNGFLWAFKAAVCQPANPPKLSKRSKPSKTRQILQTPSPAGTPDPQQWLSWRFQSCKGSKLPKFQTPSPTCTLGPRQLPQQAPQDQGHSNDFLWAFKAAVCQPAKAPNPSKIPNPQGQGHSNETFYEFQSCRLLARKGSKLSKTKFQTPSPTGTPGPRPLPQQAPQGQGQGHFPNRHPRARPQQWLSMGFQSCRLPARKPSKTLQTLQTLQNPPNPPNTVPSRHLRSTAMTFLRLSKLPFASPQRLQPPQNSKHLP